MTSTAPTIPNGRFTLRNKTTGEHRTFQIRTQKQDAKFAAGKRIIGLLDGPDNTASYRSFGFVNNNGIVVWKKFRGMMKISAFDMFARMLWQIATTGKLVTPKGEYELMVEKRCLRCNRVLTHPESLDLGIGPECAGRI